MKPPGKRRERGKRTHKNRTLKWRNNEAAESKVRPDIDLLVERVTLGDLWIGHVLRYGPVRLRFQDGTEESTIEFTRESSQARGEITVKAAAFQTILTRYGYVPKASDDDWIDRSYMTDEEWIAMFPRGLYRKPEELTRDAAPESEAQKSRGPQ